MFVVLSFWENKSWVLSLDTMAQANFPNFEHATYWQCSWTREGQRAIGWKAIWCPLLAFTKTFSYPLSPTLSMSLAYFCQKTIKVVSLNTKGFDPCNASLKDSAQYCCLEPFRPAFVYWWLCDLNHGPVFQCRYSLSIQDFFNATISWLWVLLPHDLISIHLSSLLLRIILKQ